MRLVSVPAVATHVVPGAPRAHTTPDAESAAEAAKVAQAQRLQKQRATPPAESSELRRVRSAEQTHLVRTSSAEERRRRLELDRGTALVEQQTAAVESELHEVQQEIEDLLADAADALGLDRPEKDPERLRPQPEPEPEPEPEHELWSKPQPEPEPEPAPQLEAQPPRLSRGVFFGRRRQGVVSLISSGGITFHRPVWASTFYDPLQAALLRLFLAMVAHPRLCPRLAGGMEEVSVLEMTASHIKEVSVRGLIPDGEHLRLAESDLRAWLHLLGEQFAEERSGRYPSERANTWATLASAGPPDRTVLEELAQVFFWSFEMGEVSRMWASGGPQVGSAKGGVPLQLIGSRDRLARRLQLLPSRAALTHFAKRGDSGELRRLVDVGATREQIDAADGDGKTPLYWATMTGHDEAAATLLELSADPNKPSRELVTPLMRAVRAQNLSLVRLLLRGGADCQQRDRLGRTAVDLARQKAPPDGGAIGAFLGDWSRRA